MRLVLTFFASALVTDTAPPTSYGPFEVVSTIERNVGFPYPIDVKTTTLAWTSSNSLIKYTLSDNGDRVRATLQIGRPEQWWCSFFARPMRFDLSAAVVYRNTLVPPQDCLSQLSKNDRIDIERDLAVAAKSFPGALALFREKSLQQHGPSLSRCIEYRFGNHGPICALYVPSR